MKGPFYVWIHRIVVTSANGLHHTGGPGGDRGVVALQVHMHDAVRKGHQKYIALHHQANHRRIKAGELLVGTAIKRPQ